LERWKIWSWTNIVWRSNVIFLQDLVCTCKGRSVCSKGCACFEQNLSYTELCPSQALDLCHNVITHRTDIEDDDAKACNSSFFKQIIKNNCIYLIPWISPCAIDQIKCIIQTPNLIIIGFRITMVNETCIFCGFKSSKCLKGCFYLWITLIKKLQGFTWDVQCS
jgi:hypothetical protein